MISSNLIRRKDNILPKEVENTIDSMIKREKFAYESELGSKSYSFRVKNIKCIMDKETTNLPPGDVLLINQESEERNGFYIDGIKQDLGENTLFGDEDSIAIYKKDCGKFIKSNLENLNITETLRLSGLQEKKLFKIPLRNGTLTDISLKVFAFNVVDHDDIYIGRFWRFYNMVDGVIMDSGRIPYCYKGSLKVILEFRSGGEIWIKNLEDKEVLWNIRGNIDS